MQAFLVAGDIFDGKPTGLLAAGWRQIWRVDGQGYAYRIWERIMPRVDDSVLDCTVYLYHSERDAIEGARSGGSGFLVGVPFGWDELGNIGSWGAKAHHVYAVTNEHVIDNGCSVIRLNTKEGATKVIDCSPDSWLPHQEGDDIAIAPIEPDRELFKFRYLSVALDMFVTKDLQRRCGVGPGDETFTVGRFIARDERQSNAPIVRFGHISGPRTELIEQERNNFKQESFLVESHSISGFSGAPVFVWIPLERTVSFGSPERQSQFRREVRSYQHRPLIYFLGVDWGHLEDIAPPGMAGVVPAWKLLELLRRPEVIEMRNEREKDEANTPRGKLDIRASQTQKSRAGKDIPVPLKSDFLHDLTKTTRRKKPSE